MKNMELSRRVRFLSLVLIAAGSLSCQGKERPFADTVPGAGGTDGNPMATGPGGPDPGAVGALPDCEGPGCPRQPEQLEPIGGLSGTGVDPAQAAAGSADAGLAVTCLDGATEACGPAAEEGTCKFGTRTCAAGAWGECVGAIFGGTRDCSSSEDNDCDGQPDNTLDDVCRCPVDGTQPCDEHPELDGRGPCHAGLQACVLGAGNATSDWGACTGSVGPEAADSCDIAQDDSNCDGTPNGGCNCVEGDSQPCGPLNDTGLCTFGTSVCMGGGFTACQGAVFPARRDCRSPQDNDCDGLPDNTADATCACTIGTTQACATHPGRDGNGPCRAGTQLCVAGAQNVTSNFGACTGSIGPAQRDSCTAFGDDADCNGAANSGCQCVAGRGNQPCSADPNNSRCNGQGQCAPCQTNADCSLVSGGRNLCTAGVCAAPRCGDGIVQPERGEECDDRGTVAGDGCTPDCRVAHAPVGASAFGGTHACMLQPSGQIICWGLNSSGQLGNTRTDNAILGPTRVLLTEDATQVAAGPASTCAVHGAGRLACWGLAFTVSPTDIAGLTNVTQAAVGSNQACALHSGGTVSCAPNNGAFVDMGLTNVTQISAGNGQVCARRSDSTLHCWGSNNAGQLGIGLFSNPSATPLQSLPTGVAEVSAGGETTCVRLNNGGAQCFGAGPLGNRTAPTTTAEPQQVVNLPNPLRIVSASNNRCALLSDQSVRCWGTPPLGDVDGLPTTIALPGRAVEIGAGSDVACAVLEDLSVYCWGPNISIFGLTPDPAGAQVPVELPIP
jgi:cysteine-rich repeat protein